VNDELDVLHVGTRAPEIPSRQLFLRAIVDKYADDFAWRYFSDDLAIDPSDYVEFVWPIGRVVGPAQPRGFMLLPFRRHRETQAGRRGIELGFVAIHN